MENYIVPCILNYRMEVISQIYDQAALPQGKVSLLPKTTTLGGPRGRSGDCGEECLGPAGNRTTIPRLFRPQFRHYTGSKQEMKGNGLENRQSLWNKNMKQRKTVT